MEKEKLRVLYIDDEADNLTSFNATLRRDFEIYTALSAAEGLVVLEEKQPQVIIADHRMPGMTGVEFFESIIEKHPDKIRILLTGYADIKAVVDAINRGQIYRFIEKPWDEDEIKVAIQNAFDIYLTRKQLKEKNQELEKAYNELDRFVYSTSHDLRAPLTSILGIVNVGKLENPAWEKDQYIEMIEKSVKKLDHFILNIIDYYKNSRIETREDKIDFKALIDEILEGFNFYNKGQEVNFNLDIRQEGTFISDETKLHIIFNNIISNAIKYQKAYNKDKKVNIVVISGKGKAEIIIEDNGIGIDEKYLPDIFKMFFRGTEHNSGSGIGLYIAHEAVLKLEGTLRVESKAGVGTKFYFTIPNKV